MNSYIFGKSRGQMSSAIIAKIRYTQTFSPYLNKTEIGNGNGECVKEPTIRPQSENIFMFIMWQQILYVTHISQ